ncbi:hypothetical protein GGF37_006656 [Kickxella alabastrina]|nr:hypothetical protein GGF37_006656 [Kickxella alabastrina]
MPIASVATQAEVPSTSAAAMDASSNVPAMDSAMDVDSPSWLEEPAHANVESIIESALLNIAPELPSSSTPGSHAQSPLLVESSGMLTPRKRIQTNKGRCLQCRTRVPLVKQTVNKCRCGYVFCDGHRFHDQHSCDFDIVGRDRNVLEKRNPKLNELPKGGRSFNRID